MKVFPFDSDGNLKPNGDVEYLTRRRAIEDMWRQELSRDTIFLTEKDVLLGRGKPIQDFPGNIRLASIIDDYIQRYREARKQGGGKSRLCDEVVRTVKGQGGRFLAKGEGQAEWNEVDDLQARERVSHSFRSYKSREFPSSRPSSVSASTADSDGELSNVASTDVADMSVAAKRLKISDVDTQTRSR